MNTPPAQLTIRITWLGIVNYLGALLTTGWLLYLIYATSGTTYAALALLICGVALRFGASLLLVVAAGILYFHFDVAGLWLPLLCWFAAGLAFMNDLHAYRMSQSSNPPPTP